MKALVAVAAILASSLAFAQAAKAAPASPNAEAAVREVMAARLKAYLAGDVKALLAMYADDPVIVNPAGVGARGKAEQEALLGKLTMGPGKVKNMTNEVQRVRFITPDVAVVESITRADPPPNAPAEMLERSKQGGRSVTILVNQGGRWLISDWHSFFHVPPLGAPPPEGKPTAAAPAKK